MRSKQEIRAAADQLSQKAHKLMASDKMNKDGMGILLRACRYIDESQTLMWVLEIGDWSLDGLETTSEE